MIFVSTTDVADEAVSATGRPSSSASGRLWKSRIDATRPSALIERPGMITQRSAFRAYSMLEIGVTSNSPFRKARLSCEGGPLTTETSSSTAPCSIPK